MSNFKREERYIVLKLEELTNDEICDLRDYFAEQGIKTKECVVVEPDWPNYEATWRAIQQIEEGTYDPDEIARLQSEVERLQGRCAELTEIVAMAETPCRAWYKQANDGGWQIYSAVQQAAKGNSGAWLLRKQAESAEQAAKELSTVPGAALWDCEEVQDWLARAYAKRLRQQAAEGSDETETPR